MVGLYDVCIRRLRALMCTLANVYNKLINQSNHTTFSQWKLQTSIGNFKMVYKTVRYSGVKIWNKIKFMLVQRRRRWPNGKPTLINRLEFGG